MKNIFLLVVIVILALPHARAQNLALQMQDSNPEFISYSTASFTHYKHKKEASVCLKVGTIMSAVGVVSGIVGAGIVLSNFNLLSESNNPSAENFGAVLFIAGGVLGITGAGLAIGGIVHDRSGRHRYSIVTPKKNQLGLAYNF